MAIITCVFSKHEIRCSSQVLHSAYVFDLMALQTTKGVADEENTKIFSYATEEDKTDKQQTNKNEHNTKRRPTNSQDKQVPSDHCAI